MGIGNSPMEVTVKNVYVFNMMEFMKFCKEKKLPLDCLWLRENRKSGAVPERGHFLGFYSRSTDTAILSPLVRWSIISP